MNLALKALVSQNCIIHVPLNLSKISFSLLSYTPYLQMPRAPPPPNPKMAELLRLIMEDREAARAERQANLATLQRITQMAMNRNNGNGNGNGEGENKCPR
jgi:hypothetical protein